VSTLRNRRAPDHQGDRRQNRSHGWFVEDFAQAELKTPARPPKRLRSYSPPARRSDGRFEIATLDEIAALVLDRRSKLARPIGIVAELKHAAYFDSIGMPLDRPLLAELDGPFGADKDLVILESFEPGILRRLNRATNVKLVSCWPTRVGRRTVPKLTSRRWPHRKAWPASATMPTGSAPQGTDHSTHARRRKPAADYLGRRCRACGAVRVRLDFSQRERVPAGRTAPRRGPRRARGRGGGVPYVLQARGGRRIQRLSAQAVAARGD
jgi:hypothetical protein